MEPRNLFNAALIPAATSTVVFLVGLRIAVGVDLLDIGYLQLLGSLAGAGAMASLYVGIIIQGFIGLIWGIVYLSVFETPAVANAIVFSVWQTMLTLAFIEIVLLPMTGSSLADFALADAAKLGGTFAALHLVYMMTFLSAKTQKERE